MEKLFYIIPGTIGSVLFVYVMYLAIIQSSITVKENERAVIFRFGKYCGIIGPGTTSKVPFVDFGRKINLDDVMPNWRSMSEIEISAVIEDILCNFKKF